MSDLHQKAASFINLRFPDSQDRHTACEELAQIFSLIQSDAFNAGQQQTANNVADYFRQMALDGSSAMEDAE